MIGAVQLGWTLTVVFAITGGYCLFRCVRSSVDGWMPTIADRVEYAAHCLMSLAMIAMIWPWGMRVPSWPQVLLFGLAAAWFVVAAVVRGRWHAVRHAVLQGAMVWMLLAMPPAVPAASDAGGGHAHHGGSTAEPAAQLPISLTLTGSLLAVCCVLLSLQWLSGAIDSWRSAPDGPEKTDPRVRVASMDGVQHSAMSLGMAAMLWAMF